VKEHWFVVLQIASTDLNSRIISLSMGLLPASLLVSGVSIGCDWIYEDKRRVLLRFMPCFNIHSVDNS
jgi:hypothetical protein